MARITTIVDSLVELSAKEKVMLKDVSDAINLDKALEELDGKALLINPANFITLEVRFTGEDAEKHEDYTTYIVVEKETGSRYYTSSQSFANSALDIIGEMKDCEEPWELKVFKKESRNYAGKGFITCTLV